MSETLPLFPLGMVLFPGCRVPLHIFEDRYKQMIAECLEHKTEFCIVMGTDDDFADIGCGAHVSDVINTFADGRMNIVVEGTDRIRIIDRNTEGPYITGTVERVPDEGREPDKKLVSETRKLYVEALKLSIGWYRAPERVDESTGLLSYAIGSALGLPAERQQILLEQTSIAERFRLLREMLESALGGLREHARKVGGNGRVHRE
jgi:ATP-dependent Lon protease